MLSVYALVIRFAGAWIVAIALVHVTALLWLDQALGGSPYEGFGLVLCTGLSLLGRVPDDRAAALLACVRDLAATAELREALLAALSTPGRPHAPELLAWLQAQDGVEQPFGLDVAVLRARAVLADLSAALPLAELAADAWSHRRVVGEQSIDALIEARGLTAMLTELGAASLEMLAFADPRPPLRLLGVRLLERAGADLKRALADPDVIVAQRAYLALAATRGDDDALRAMVHARAPGHLWALAVLHRRGPAARPLWEALGRPRIELPGVPADVRAAIVRAYAPGERETDPRWLLEAAWHAPAPAIDEDELLRRAGEALAAAGCQPQAPISAEQQYQQGAGTFHTFTTAAGTVTVSTLGPFFTLTGADPQAQAAMQAAMQAAGFRHIDAALAAIRVDGLHVYYFGTREPLDVGTLLFYWQD